MWDNPLYEEHDEQNEVIVYDQYDVENVNQYTHENYMVSTWVNPLYEEEDNDEHIENPNSKVATHNYNLPPPSPNHDSYNPLLPSSNLHPFSPSSNHRNHYPPSLNHHYPSPPSANHNDYCRDRVSPERCCVHYQSSRVLTNEGSRIVGGPEEGNLTRKYRKSEENKRIR